MKTSDFQFERPDWWLFRLAESLSQKAGVQRSRLRRLVLKELVDNALDASDGSGMVTVGALDDAGDRFYVQDEGAGIDGGPEAVARVLYRPSACLDQTMAHANARGDG